MSLTSIVASCAEMYFVWRAPKSHDRDPQSTDCDLLSTRTVTILVESGSGLIDHGHLLIISHLPSYVFLLYAKPVHIR